MNMLKPLQIYSRLLLVILPVLAVSCYPGGPSVTEDLDLVGTMHDESFDFQGAATYSLPDTVIHIIGEDEDPEDVNRDYDDLILSLTKTNMDALGYQYMEFDTTNPADVVLLATVLVTTSSGIYYDPGWWWNYWGYWPGWGGYPGYPGWGPGWGYGYPWGYPIYYSYSTGSIFLTMVNPEDYDPDDKTIGVVWTAALNGLAQGGKQSTRTRISEGINQAFKQSEQILKTN
jgi:hypothetical protein